MRKFIIRLLLPKKIKNQINWLLFNEINKLERPNQKESKFPEHINKIFTENIKETRRYLNLK